MILRMQNKLIISLLFVFSLLIAAGTADSAPVTPIYEVTGFGDFGPVIGGPLETHFGGFGFLEGNATSTVYRADEAFDLIQGGDTAHIDVDYLTLVYRIDAIAYGNIDFFQVNFPLELSSEPIIAVGWNSTVSDVALNEVNTEEDINFQIEFGNTIGGSPGAFGLDPGETLEMFITFQNLDFAETTAQVWGGGIPPGNVAVLGAIASTAEETPEPWSIAMALSAMLGLGGMIARRVKG